MTRLDSKIVNFTQSSLVLYWGGANMYVMNLIKLNNIGLNFIFMFKKYQILVEEFSHKAT